ncbi:putative receptor-like protein kinase [Tanacetum coccineum]
MEEFDHLKIKLQDIRLATNNFGRDKLIGHGGFGQVYKGELILPNGPSIVSFKRLDRKLGQGNPEFYKEIMMLSKYKHENLVSLMHFCNQGDEMILVYEYAPRGSLDRYLSDASLTWSQRLKICVGVARGLNFLHHPTEMYQRVIHRDIKSANILLDDKWKAKVSDFGLSKAGPANQMQTFIFSHAVGTPGYCDPLYFETGFLSKESDVYSFGVVLFEVILDEIILRGLKEQMESGSFSTFSHIAYRRVNKAREEPPTMDEVLKELDIALEQQEVYKNLEMKVDIQEMIKIADQAIAPLSYETQEQLFRLFLKGIFVDDGTTWLSINKNGDICEMISATKCVSWGERMHQRIQVRSGYGSSLAYTIIPLEESNANETKWINFHLYGCSHKHVNQERPDASLTSRNPELAGSLVGSDHNSNTPYGVTEFQQENGK